MTVDRHDGRGPQPFVAPKQKITRKFSGSAYDPDASQATTRIAGPTGWAQGVEDGNRLADHNPVTTGPFQGRSSIAAFDPETGRTSGAMGPRGWAKMVEDGNTLDRHADMMPRSPTSRFSGSAYDPMTDRTTTVMGRPGAYGRLVERGNTLFRH